VALFALVFLAAGWFLITTPFYILGRRRGLDHPWVAFPLLGIAIVLFESIGKSGWLGLLVFVPTVGRRSWCSSGRLSRFLRITAARAGGLPR
jgi:hypothetical protein